MTIAAKALHWAYHLDKGGRKRVYHYVFHALVLYGGWIRFCAIKVRLPKEHKRFLTTWGAE